MKNLRVKDIIKITKGVLVYGNLEVICDDYCKDTRIIKKNDVYIGIKGENFDGNKLYKEAVEKGASVCILQDFKEEEIELFDNVSIILVKNTIKALQEIASYKRNLYNILVIAITGSVGKTSTKDLVSSVVAQKFDVLKTQGNLNNQIGLPLTILGLKEHTALVVELGMNNIGEVETLSKIAKPNIAIITNIGTAHIGNLGSKENILKAKLEIISGLKEDGVLIINNDDNMLNNCYVNNKKIVTYGIVNRSDYNAFNVNLNENSSSFEVLNDKIEVFVGGKHFVYNSLCAYVVGKYLEIPENSIIKGIKEFKLTERRMEIINLNNNITIIDDSYNASYDSAKASIEYLSHYKNRRKIFVLGDILELGVFAKDLIEKVGEEIYKNKINVLITSGQLSNYASDKVNELNKKNYIVDLYKCNTNDEVAELIESMMKHNDVFLLKASNKSNFCEIIGKISHNY